MQRRRLSNGDILPNNTISGNGPYYDINYGDGTGVPGHVHVGYTLYADHKEAGTGSLISRYEYKVTSILSESGMTVMYVDDSNEIGDENPVNLCDGTGSSAGCGGVAPNEVWVDLNQCFYFFMD